MANSTLLSIETNFNNPAINIIPVLPQITNSSNIYTGFFKTVSSIPVMMGTIDVFSLNIFFSVLSKEAIFAAFYFLSVNLVAYERTTSIWLIIPSFFGCTIIPCPHNKNSIHQKQNYKITTITFLQDQCQCALSNCQD